MLLKWRLFNLCKRYKISFEYLGADFFGSQIQKIEPTVQGELTKAICTLTKNKNAKVIMAGRTDSGVSAYNQVAHFDSDFLIEDKIKFLISLNALLPKGLRVFEIENVASFHAQKSATYRHYRYIINNSPFSSAFDLNAHHIRGMLDVERMDTAIKFILGEHDFSAFKSVSDNPAAVCKIYYAAVKKQVKKDAEYILIDIVGNRFLYNMVRAIVGTLVLIETKNLLPSFMKEVLESQNRTKAGCNINPIGLTLIKTGYDNPETYVENIQKGNNNENL